MGMPQKIVNENRLFTPQISEQAQQFNYRRVANLIRTLPVKLMMVKKIH
jgi:hypothetical protein